MSERVEIGKALEAELAKRHGNNQHTAEDPENFPAPKGDTRDLAAKASVMARPTKGIEHESR